MKRAFAVLLLVGASCGGASGSPKLASKNAIDIVLVGPKIDVPFDPKSARLEEATAQLHALVGHPIRFELDSAVFSESKDKFEDMVLADVEVVAADLAKLKKSAPAAFSHGAPLLERVRLRYDATYDEHDLDAKLDPAAHALTITGRGGGWGVTQGVVAAALVRELDDYALRHYGTAEPEAIPPAEREAYFQFLTDWRKRQRWVAEHPKPQSAQRFPHSPDAELVRKITKLSSMTHQEPLSSQIRKWLFDRLSEYANAYRSDADGIAALPESHEWRVADRAYGAWLGAQIPSSSEDERVAIARHVFQTNKTVTTFPGFDRMAFGLAVIDAWIKNGHDARPIAVTIVCPVETKDGKHEPVQRCDHVFYRWVIESDATIAIFGDALAARADAKLVEASVAAIASLGREEKTRAIAAIGRAVVKDEALWRTAIVTAADEVAELDARAFTGELVRLWDELPERRGTLLYALAWTDRAAPRTIGWVNLTPRASAADFAAALDQPRPMQVIHRVWPGLGKGWSRTQVLAPFLTKFVDGERAPGEADETIRGIAHAMCEEHATADLQSLVAFFDKRRTEHPTERYAKVVTESATCQLTTTAHLPLMH